MSIRVQEAASVRLDEIYRYTRDTWGEAQAETYITGLFAAFEQIETRGVHSRAVPAEFGVEGHFFRYERHFVYWRHLSNGDIGIVVNGGVKLGHGAAQNWATLGLRGTRVMGGGQSAALSI